MKNIFVFGLLLGLSVTAFASSSVETREHVLSETVVNASECHSSYKSIRPVILINSAYVAVKQKVEVYKVTVTSTSWWSKNTEQFIEGSNQIVERNVVEEKLFPSLDQCKFWSSQQPHAK